MLRSRRILKLGRDNLRGVQLNTVNGDTDAWTMLWPNLTSVSAFQFSRSAAKQSRSKQQFPTRLPSRRARPKRVRHRGNSRKQDRLDQVGTASRGQGGRTRECEGLGDIVFEEGTLAFANFVLGRNIPSCRPWRRCGSRTGLPGCHIPVSKELVREVAYEPNAAV